MGKGIGELRIVGSNPTDSQSLFFCFLFCFLFFHLFLFLLICGASQTKPPPIPPFFFIDSTKLIFLYTIGYTKIPLSNAATFCGMRLQQKSILQILWQVSVASTAELHRIHGRNP